MIEAAEVKRLVLDRIAEVLDTPDVGVISTAELVARIHLGKDPAMRTAVFNAVARMANNKLAAYCRKGERESVRKRKPGGGWCTVSRRPWLWALYGSPHDEAPKHCPACGQLLKGKAHEISGH